MEEKVSYKGRVKWFSSEKGYGFISCEDIENDIYVHFSDIQMKGFKSLDQNDLVVFEYDSEMQKALNVQKLSVESIVENSIPTV